MRIVSDANRINPIEGLLIDGWVRDYGDARHAATLLQKTLDTRITIREESAGNGTGTGICERLERHIYRYRRMNGDQAPISHWKPGPRQMIAAGQFAF